MAQYSGSVKWFNNAKGYLCAASLLQLIPTMAGAFTHERITASHGNLCSKFDQLARYLNMAVFGRYMQKRSSR